MCVHKFIAAESEDLTPLVNIINVGHYLSRFSILVKVYFEVRFPFAQYPNTFFRRSLPQKFMCLPSLGDITGQLWKETCSVLTILYELYKLWRALLCTITSCLRASVSFHYCKLLTCFNQLAILQVSYLLRSTCTVEICLLLQIAYLLQSTYFIGAHPLKK